MLGKQVSHLRDILALAPLLPNITRMLDQIVQQVVITADPIDDFQSTPYNASLVLGMCLKSISGRVKSPKSNTPSHDLGEICQQWGWSESVMDALAHLAASRCVANEVFFFAALDIILVLDTFAQRRWRALTRV